MEVKEGVGFGVKMGVIDGVKVGVKMDKCICVVVIGLNSFLYSIYLFIFAILFNKV